MKKIALITGILGQDGPYLAKYLLEKDYKIYGMIRRYSNPNFNNLDFLGITNKIEFVDGDMADESSLINLVKSLRPVEIYNLAAQSFVGSSWDMAKITTEVNCLGVLYLLNAIKFFSPTTKFYQASSSEMFGLSNPGGFLNENSYFYPRSPYGISKVYSFWMTKNYRESFGLFTTNGILFNHESPIRGIQFVTRKISNGVARIKIGLDSELRLGNLDAKRDWGFAGDYVKAMYLMMQQPKCDDYVIGTGASHTVKDFVKAAFEYIGIKDWQKYIKIDPRFKRPSEVPALKADYNKAKKELGWKPSVDFKKLVGIMVEADLKRVKVNQLNKQSK